MLRLDDVHVYYGAIHALKGISLSVEEGEIVALIGANGAGKSTTVRAISGLERHQQGTITLAGGSLQGIGAAARVGMGLVLCPEGRQVFPNLTVDENLRIGAYLRRDKAGVARDLDRVYGIFDRLRERHKQRAGTLSGGEQQMLAVGRAMMSRPRVLLLDEPSLGLAPQITRQIFDVLLELNAEDGLTLLIIEQNAQLALRTATRGYVLETGSIVLEGPADQLLADPEVRAAYLGM